ncbi:MAG: type II secretion system protein GspG [Deltaproteobacteria bacterium]|nr:type II secretion system protein GspG [Deltaproteobacteria bacterium]
MARKRSEPSIRFPWERRTGLAALPWARTKPVAATLAMMGLLLFLGARERDRAGIRATRATLLVVREAVDAFRADHERRCPDSLAKLREEGYLAITADDAWGRPLQLSCPGRRNPDSYDLLSYGPSGDMRGLDRVE